MFCKLSLVETDRLDRIEEHLRILNHKVTKLIMTNEEYRDAVSKLADQLVKALGEIQAELQNLDQVPQAAVDRLTAAQDAAQKLDDLNADQEPPPQP